MPDRDLMDISEYITRHESTHNVDYDGDEYECIRYYQCADIRRMSINYAFKVIVSSGDDVEFNIEIEPIWPGCDMNEFWLDFDIRHSGYISANRLSLQEANEWLNKFWESGADYLLGFCEELLNTG
jgi:hypothetical protein